MITRFLIKSLTSNILAFPLRFPLPYAITTNIPILCRSRRIFVVTRIHQYSSSFPKMSSVTTRSQSRASASTSTPPGPAPTENTTSTQATAQSPTLISEPETGPVYFWREYGSPYDFLSQWYPSAFTAPGDMGGGMYFSFPPSIILSSISCPVSHHALTIQQQKERGRR